MCEKPLPLNIHALIWHVDGPGPESKNSFKDFVPAAWAALLELSLDFYFLDLDHPPLGKN